MSIMFNFVHAVMEGILCHNKKVYADFVMSITWVRGKVVCIPMKAVATCGTTINEQTLFPVSAQSSGSKFISNRDT